MKKQIVCTEWFSSFACPGGDCGLTCCCDDWTILLSDSEMKLYSEIDGYVGDEVRKAIDFDKKCLKTEKEGRCNLINEEGYCNIVLSLGENYLSKTCSLFPREGKDYKFMDERYVEILCPLVAERLFESKTMEFAFSEQDVEDEDINISDALYVFNMFSLRTKLIETFQSFPGKYIHGKMFLLVRAYEYVRDLVLAEDGINEININFFIEKYIDNNNFKYIFESCEKFAEMRNEKANFLIDSFSNMYKIGAIKILFNVVQKKFPFIEKKLCEWMTDRESYIRCFDGYSSYIKEVYPCFEQNFMVYSMFLNWIDNDVENYGEKLCGRFVELMLIHLCGMAIFDFRSGFDIKELSVMISAIDRNLAHSQNNLEEMGRSYAAMLKTNPICIMESII